MSDTDSFISAKRHNLTSSILYKLMPVYGGKPPAHLRKLRSQSQKSVPRTRFSRIQLFRHEATRHIYTTLSL
ncbi:uncharacterized protein RAG0_07698 [Rhynchosporium agropyri]|uniref:Uncharacterized protein n=1 Tax=Rhynchosporium agropyri TaxID=914238 RepID=A0A1E1KMV0_9HELO|nr:uncharacterized protein RAG0_07698 [Rhynchosporium agropyri]